MLEEGPSKLFDALASILGLEELVADADALKDARGSRSKIHKKAKDKLKELRASLEAHPDERVPWCTTRDLGPQLSCTRGYEVPHEHFQTHSAEVCEEGLSREELA